MIPYSTPRSFIWPKTLTDVAIRRVFDAGRSKWTSRSRYEHAGAKRKKTFFALLRDRWERTPFQNYFFRWKNIKDSDNTHRNWRVVSACIPSYRSGLNSFLPPCLLFFFLSLAPTLNFSLTIHPFPFSTHSQSLFPSLTLIPHQLFTNIPRSAMSHARVSNFLSHEK